VLYCKAHHDTYPEIDSSTQSNHTGHTIFITGASKGIGRATAISYVKAGASQIAIAARSDLSDVEADMLRAAKEAGKPEPKVLKIKLDVQNRQSVVEAGNVVRKEFGRLDVVINNAGYLSEYIKFLEADEEAFWRTWEINLRGIYWVTKELLPLLIETSSGLQTIVNVSSTGALNLADGGGAYQASKFAVLRFTEFTCVDYADKGIVAFSVHPGGIPTELSLNMPSTMHHRKY
jgi:NAD(P)-dependent dehydrogenase (short-subunit alcohol dehydrogenase family)